MGTLSTAFGTGQANQAAPARSPRLLAKTFLVLGLITALYADVAVSLVSDWWNDEGYSYGFLIVPFAAYIAWTDRRLILAEPIAPSSRGILLTLSACLAYLVGRLASEFFLTRTSLVLLLAGLTWTFWGRRRLRRLLFPFLLLATAVPIPGILYYRMTMPLQLLASHLATLIVQSLGIVIYRDGNIIHLATTSLGVAEACSGLRSASSLAISGLLVGYLECSRLLSRTALFALAIPLAISFNILRVTLTAVLAEEHRELAVGFYHLFSGWLVYVCGLAVLFLVGRFLRNRERKGIPA